MILCPLDSQNTGSQRTQLRDPKCVLRAKVGFAMRKKLGELIPPLLPPKVIYSKNSYYDAMISCHRGLGAALDLRIALVRNQAVMGLTYILDK